MKSAALFFCFLRWDMLRELRRKETLANMTFFAVLVLFVAQFGFASDKQASESVGPVIFWITVLFAGTVGLSQTFASEREGSSLHGIVTSPVDLGVFYLAKVAATWIYVMIMEILALGAYSLLFNFSPMERAGHFLLVMGVFTLAYISAGVVLAAMTTTLRGGGELVLRILLIPLMLPAISLTLNISQLLFDSTLAAGTLGPPMKPVHYYAILLAFDTIYILAGYLLFPKVLEE